MMLMRMVMMMKIFKPFIKLIKFLYSLIDKYIVIPISRLVYRINELTRNNSGKIERILNINKFNHLICDRYWKDIKKENKFICNMCNSVHFITNKISKKEGKMNGNCLVF